ECHRARPSGRESVGAARLRPRSSPWIWRRHRRRRRLRGACAGRPPTKEGGRLAAWGEQRGPRVPPPPPPGLNCSYRGSKRLLKDATGLQKVKGTLEKMMKEKECFSQGQENGGKGEAHLIQEEVWLLNLSQGVSKEAEHEFLHLEPVDSPQLLPGKEVMEEATNDEATLQPNSLAQTYPLVFKEELLELRKGHLAMLRTLSSPVGRKPSVWHWLTKGPRLV
ncbi:zinc fingers and homeoboxes 3, isoform CRA_b, partial [Mus musculus]